MPKTRDYYLMKDETVSDSGTVTKDLNVKKPIQWIEFMIEQTVDTNDYDDHPLHKDVSKIEIVDGATTLWSLSMIQAQALDCFHLGKFPYMLTNTKGASTNKESVIIPFGFNLHDVRHYFDPTRYTNPQLKITYSLTTGTGYWTANGTKFTVRLRLIEEGAMGYGGFLMAKEIKSGTLPTSGEERIDLPNDYPYRMLMIRAYYTGERVDEDVTQVKLTCDADAFVPFDLLADEINQMQIERWGFFTDFIKASKQDNEVVYARLQDVWQAFLRPTADGHMGCVESIDAEKCTIGLYNIPAATPAKVTSDELVEVIARGIQPHACWAFMFGPGDDESYFFPAKNYGDIDLVLTCSGSGAAYSVVLQQLRT